MQVINKNTQWVEVSPIYKRMAIISACIKVRVVTKLVLQKQKRKRKCRGATAYIYIKMDDAVHG